MLALTKPPPEQRTFSREDRNQGERELILHLISKTCNEVTMHSYVASAVSATKAKTRSSLDPDQQKPTHLAPIACHGVS